MQKGSLSEIIHLNIVFADASRPFFLFLTLLAAWHHIVGMHASHDPDSAASICFILSQIPDPLNPKPLKAAKEAAAPRG